MWFNSGNRYLHCDAVGEDSMLNEDGGLTVAVWGGGNCKKCLKRGWNEAKMWRNKTLDWGGGGC